MSNVLLGLSFFVILSILKCSRGITNKTVFVLRVIANDASTSPLSSKLSEQIFGSNFSLSAQYEACSFGQFMLLPFNDTTTTKETIIDGIGDVTIKNNAIGNSAAILREAVLAAATDKYGDG